MFIVPENFPAAKYRGRKFVSQKAFIAFMQREQRTAKRVKDGTTLFKFGQAQLNERLEPIRQNNSHERRESHITHTCKRFGISK